MSSWLVVGLVAVAVAAAAVSLVSARRARASAVAADAAAEDGESARDGARRAHRQARALIDKHLPPFAELAAAYGIGRERAEQLGREFAEQCDREAAAVRRDAARARGGVTGSQMVRAVGPRG